MFDITCPHCEVRSLLTTGSIVDFVNTADGPMAHVRCPRGHDLVHDFHSRTTTVYETVSLQVA